MSTVGSDSFAGATLLPFGSVSDPTPTAGLTTETGEQFNTTGLTRTAWWQFTAPSDESVNVDLGKSDIGTATGPDSYLAIWTGSSLGALTLVASDDDGYPDTDYARRYLSRITFAATAGTTYYVQAALYSSEPDISYVLRVCTRGTYTTAWLPLQGATLLYSAGGSLVGSDAVGTDDGDSSYLQHGPRQNIVSAGSSNIDDSSDAFTAYLAPATDVPSGSGVELDMVTVTLKSSARNVTTPSGPYLNWYVVPDPSQVTGTTSITGQKDVSGSSSGVNVYYTAATTYETKTWAWPFSPYEPTTAQLAVGGKQYWIYSAGGTDAGVSRISYLALQFTFDVYYLTPSAVTHAPPLRQWPRSDALGASSARRLWPLSPSIQASNRRAGGYL